MKTLILLSNTNIINQIFKLVTNKLSIKLEILEPNQPLNETDIIVVDQDCDQNIDYNLYCSHTVYLTKDDIGNSQRFDYILKKPFLPSQLQNLLENIDKQPTKHQIPSPFVDTNDTLEDDVDDLISFVSDMTDEIEPDKHNDYDQYDNDESLLIKKEDLGDGGVLDKDELSKLHELINDEEDISPEIQEEQMDENNWVDLSNIIDQAIDDISDYQFDTNKPIKLILNEYSMSELKTLFNKLDQNIIDNLADGKDILLQLRLEK